MAQKQLVVTYGADTSPIKKAAKEIEDAHTSMGSKVSGVGKDMAGQLEKLGSAFGINLGPVKNLASQAGGALQGLRAEGGAALQGLEGAAGKAEGAVGGLGSGIGALAGPIGIGIGAAVGLAVAYKGAADTAANVAGEIRKLQAITGASAEDASRLRHEFVHFGVDADAGGVALVKFSKNLEEGSAKFKGWFTNAELANMKGKDLIQVLPLLAQKYQSLGTAVEKNTFLIDAFGKGGTVLRAILSANADEIIRVQKESDKLGLTFSQKGLVAAKAYTMAQRDLGEAMKGIQVTAGQAAIPAITNFIHSLTTGIEGIRAFNGWIEKMDHGLGGLGTILGGPIAWSLKAWHLATGDNTKAIQDQRTALENDNQTIQDNAAEAQKAAQAQQTFADSIIKQFNIVGNAADGVGALTTATTAMGKADDKAAVDRQKLNELTKDGVINTTALAAATKNIETTARATEAADVARVKSIDNVNAALKKEADATKALQTLLAGPTATDQSTADENIGKAKIANTEASLGLQDAIAAENTLKATAGVTDRQLLDASLTRQKAQYASVDATNAEKAAEQALYDLQHAADVGSVQRVTAEDNLKSAHDAVTDALRAEVDQERALVDAQLAQADAAKALEVAQAPDEALVKGIADAQRQLNQDLQTVGTTTDKVAVTFATFKAQIIQNVTDMNNWATNLQYLMDHNVSAAILDPLAALGPKAGPLLQQIRDEVSAHGVTTINQLGDNLQTATEKIQQTLQDEKAKADAYWAANPLQVSAQLKLTLDQASLTNVGGAIGGALGSGAKVKGFASGGTVPGPIGSPQFILAHGGEEITPIGGGTGSSGGNVYVTVNVGGNVTADHAIADTVYERLLELKRRQGTLGLS